MKMALRLCVEKHITIIEVPLTTFRTIAALVWRCQRISVDSVTVALVPQPVNEMMLANLDSGGGTLFLFDSLGFSLRRGTLNAQRFDFAHCLHAGIEVSSFGKLFSLFHEVSH